MYDSRVEASVFGNLHALRALGHAAGLKPEEIAEQVFPEGQDLAACLIRFWIEAETDWRTR